MMTHRVYLPHQQDVDRVWRGLPDDCPELTCKMPTASGKTLVFTKRLLELQGRNRLVVFPRLALISQFYNRYSTDLSGTHCLIVCTDQKDIRNTAAGDRMAHLEGREARDRLRRLSDNEGVLILTTYMSLPIVLGESTIAFALTVFDEAHHRSEPANINVIDRYRDRLGFVANFTATPTPECGGYQHVYPFRQAIEDKVIRDFMVHFIYVDHVGDDSTAAVATTDESLASSIGQISNLTGNRRCMVFTAYANAERTNRANVNTVVKMFRKAGFHADGITSETESVERERLLEKLGNATGTDPMFLVSCRTLSEGIDCPNVNCVVFWDSRTSIIEIIQIIGRALRPYRDADGTILPDQPDASVIIRVPIRVSEYRALPDDEARDAYLRDQVYAENGCFQSILNVASALKEADPDMAENCLYYPMGPRTRETIQKTREERYHQGFRIVDIERDGNCFFRSLEPVVGKPHEVIRQEVVDRLLEYPREKRVVWGMEDDDHARELYNDGMWANEVMDVIPKIAAEMYGLDLSIYTDKETPLERFEDGPTRVDLQLLDGHYNRLEAIDPHEPPVQQSPSRPYRRRFRGHVDPSCRVLWSLCHKSLERGLAVAQHSVEGVQSGEMRAIEKAQRSIDFYRANENTWPNKRAKDDSEKSLGKWCINYRSAKRGTSAGTTYDKVDAMLLDADPTFFCTEEERAIKKAQQSIDFYRANENTWPKQRAKDDSEKILGNWCINYRKAKWGTSAGTTYDKVDAMLLDADPTFFCTEEERAIKKAQQSIDFYRANENTWPKQRAKDDSEKILGNWCINYRKAKWGRGTHTTYDKVDAMLLDADPTFFDYKNKSELKKQCPAKTKRAPRRIQKTTVGIVDHDAKIDHECENMTEEDLREFYKKHRRAESTAKRGEYLAPNKEMKDKINHILREILPPEGTIIVLDAEDFGTATVLGEAHAHRMIIPQRDRGVYKKMQQHPVFGACVRHCDLADVDLTVCGPIGVIYADLMGSISELRPLLERFTGAVYTLGAVIAATISCRDGANPSAYTNDFATELAEEMSEALRTLEFRKYGRTMVYGESMRMATAIRRRD